MLIPADALNRAEKNIPKNKLECLNVVQILIDDDYKHLVTTDLKTTQDVKIQHTQNPDYPNVENIEKSFPETSACCACIATEQLEILVKILKQRGDVYAYNDLESIIKKIPCTAPTVQGKTSL